MYWYLEGATQLTGQARDIIQNATNEVLISPASYWEIAIKVSLGKWQLNRPYEELLELAVNQYAFDILPIRPAHTSLLVGLPFHHRDPFDRLLVAQALIEQIPLISSDLALDAYQVHRIW